MIRESAGDADAISIVVVDAGNTRTKIARYLEGAVEDVSVANSQDEPATRDALATVRGKCANRERQAIVICSVVPDETELLIKHIEEDLDLRAFVIGDNTDLPMEVAVDVPAALGVDRVCTAAAAYVRIQQACVVVDVGSAVTVDFVDADGVFQGGAILPGPRTQAASLAATTAQLPLIEPGVVESVIGRNTSDAITSGIVVGLAGAIRGLVEEIATETGTWPQTVLTGGAAELLKDRLTFVDNWVPDLCLMGAGLAYLKRMAAMRDA
ncbi:MAG: type III pantothenate kinase [Phycisphaerales bacterium]|nr:type III pantothenate kinase [Phycisphaerales bacterium]